MKKTTQVPTIVYDGPAVSRFCRSVALSVALQQLTRLHYTEISSSNLVTALYMAWYGEGPSADIHQASKQKIHKTTEELHDKFLHGWVKKVAEEGPAAGNQYIAQLYQLRASSRQAYETLCRDAAKINRQLAQNAERLKNAAAVVKLGATVGVAAMPLIAAAPAVAMTSSGLAVVSGIGLAYNCTAALVKTWEHAPTSKVAAVSWESGKAAVSEGGGRAAEGFAKRSGEVAESLCSAVERSRATTQHISRQLGQKGLGQASRARMVQDLNNTMQATGRMQDAAWAAKTNAGRAGLVKKAVPVVFFAWDVWNAVSEFRDDLRS
jgi:hypothetical protein